MISIIVAVSENGIIGKDNQLPWHIPEDLKRFKEITTGHPVIMGRNTFESIGKPLPNRTNIILTRTVKGVEVKNNCIFTDTIFIKALQESDLEWFVIGGESIYRYFLPYVDKIYLTRINQEITGNKYFTFNEAEFTIIEQISGKDQVYDFITYKRK